MLTIDNLEFSYTKDPQYKFNFNVEPGEVIGISGESGSGKSTLLDLLAGFQTQSSGAIDLDEKTISNLQPEDRPVSILFQKDNVFAHLTAEQNVQLGTKERVDVGQKLHDVGLAEFTKQKCASLSGGQQQRVALARTLARNQPILLLDEPFSALDDKTANQMRHLVKKLVQQHQWHTILVSHHKADFDMLADKVLLLRDDELNAVG
ncbi:ATP-binding cassette domain-containing protein [Maritalea sp.]|uniref:ATP-binding cassette domain-containing protein n=1 Tax=Maritalea sp. TaxID=2003361 RepID=UPI003EF45067